jgi:hypothetical protein
MYLPNVLTLLKSHTAKKISQTFLNRGRAKHGG